MRNPNPTPTPLEYLLAEVAKLPVSQIKWTRYEEGIEFKFKLQMSKIKVQLKSEFIKFQDNIKYGHGLSARSPNREILPVVSIDPPISSDLTQELDTLNAIGCFCYNLNQQHPDLLIIDDLEILKNKILRDKFFIQEFKKEFNVSSTGVLEAFMPSLEQISPIEKIYVDKIGDMISTLRFIWTVLDTEESDIVFHLSTMNSYFMNHLKHKAFDSRTRNLLKIMEY